MDLPTTEQIREWAEKISQSDREAFNALFRVLYYPLTYYAYRYTKSRDQACDIVQDVFVLIWQDREEIDPDQSLKSYLYKMVRNKSLNHMRDHTNRMVHLDNLSGNDAEASYPAEMEDHQTSANHLKLKFMAWIDELSDRRKEAFELSRFEGLNHDEIADVMNLSVKTVNNHIVDALSHLRKRYDSHIENEKSIEE
jgi:RNA polymerase sigma-70 factor, ECF subfamily